MENLEKRSVFIQKIFEVFFHSTLILMLFSWACPISVRGRQIPFFEISYILLFLTFLVRLVCDFKFSIPQIFRHYLAIIKSSKPIFWALVLYMAYGAATVLFAKSKMFSLSRYITVIQMLAFCVFLFYYVFPKDKRCDSRQKLRSVFLDLGIASILISITAIIGYLTGIYTVYVRKMSTIIDYNQFAIVILIGFVAFCGVMIRSSQPVVSKYVWIAIVAILDISVILLSGSRRCFIIVLLFVMLLVATAVADGNPGHEEKRLAERRCTKASN